MDKVIEFPKHKVVRDVPGEVLEERQRKSDEKMAEAMVEEICGIIVTELDNYNIEVTNKQFSKDFMLVLDSLQAAVFRQLGLDHHLHSFIDNNIKIIESGEKLTKEELQEKILEVMESLSEARDKLDSEEE